MVKTTFLLISIQKVYYNFGSIFWPAWSRENIKLETVFLVQQKNKIIKIKSRFNHLINIANKLWGMPLVGTDIEWVCVCVNQWRIIKITIMIC